MIGNRSETSSSPRTALFASGDAQRGVLSSSTSRPSHGQDGGNTPRLCVCLSALDINNHNNISQSVHVNADITPALKGEFDKNPLL